MKYLHENKKSYIHIVIYKSYIQKLYTNVFTIHSSRLPIGSRMVLHRT